MICFCLKKKVKNITPLAPFYKETAIKYNTSSAQGSLRGCTGTMHVIKFYIFFIIIIFFHLSFIRSFTLKIVSLVSRTLTSTCSWWVARRRYTWIVWEEQRLNRFWSEKRCRNSTFTFGPPKSVLPSSF